MALRLPPRRRAPAAAARLRGAPGGLARVRRRPAMAVLLVAVFAALSFGPAAGGLAAENAAKFDTPRSPTRWRLADPLFSPLARWDAVWYLRVAQLGLRDATARAAFFPLYPLLVRGAGELCRRLARRAAGRRVRGVAGRVPRRADAALAAGRARAGPAARRARPAAARGLPGALYFGAPYSESLFLLLSVGAFYAARTGRWAWAGAVRGARRGHPQRRDRAAVLPLADPAGGRRARARPAGRAWLRSRRSGWRRSGCTWGWRGRRAASCTCRRRGPGVAVPFAGAWDGLGAALDGAAPARVGAARGRLLPAGGGRPLPGGRAQPDPVRLPRVRRGGRGRRVRRLPRAYGAYVVAAAGAAAQRSRGPQPLMSLPRFLAVLFPVFMWLALVCEERRATDAGRWRSPRSGSACSPRSSRPGTDRVTPVAPSLLDAFGTLVELQPPAPRLRRLLARARLRGRTSRGPRRASPRRSRTTSSHHLEGRRGIARATCATAAPRR